MTHWLAVEGIVGAGKTTTVELLRPHLHAVTAFEEPDEHPLLDAYFRNPPLFAFETELIFMALHRFRLKQAVPGVRLLSDFAPEKDLVFGALVLPDADLATLRTVQASLWPDYLRPGLTIFLDVPIDECLRRAARRGRSHERALTADFLDRLREGYLDSLPRFGDRVVKVDLSGNETPDTVASAVRDLAGAE